MSLFTCSCGRKTTAISYIDGKKRCYDCKSNTLSGKWERENTMERQYYAKDILQLKNKDGTINQDFVNAYGEKQVKKLLK